MKSILKIFIIICAPLAVLGQSKNISKVEVPLVPVTDPAVVGTLPSESVSRNIQYTDALGRPIQQLSLGATPAGNDIISSGSINDLGRQEKGYLPYVGNTGDGDYQTNWLTDLNNFYNGQNTIPAENKPFSKVVYEASTRGKVEKAFGVGSYYINNNKYSTTKTGTSGKVEIKKWVINGSELTADTFFDEGELFYQEVITNEGKRVRTYTDLDGKLILKGIYEGEEQRTYQVSECLRDFETGKCLTPPITETITVETWKETRYVYDQYNNLKFILTPLLTNQDAISASDLNTYAFQFKHDTEGRITESKKPGAGWEYIIYDQWGRPVLQQDARLRQDGLWSFVKYDQFDRVVLSGVFNTGLSRSELRTEALAHTVAYEIKSANSIGYSLNRTYPTSISESDLLSITHYDDYNFLLNASWDTDGHIFSFASPSGFNETTTSLTLNDYATGNKVRILDTDTWLNSVSYFNVDGELVQVVAENHLSGVDRISFQYDFKGQLIKSLLNHSSNTDAVSILEEFEYDHSGRLLNTYHTIDNGARTLLANYAYNELGQVIENNLHGLSSNEYLQSIDYSYDIEGRLRTINNAQLSVSPVNNDANDLFGMELVFGDEALNVEGTAIDLNYDGQITAMKWNTDFPDDGKKQQIYGYKYDDENQLTNAYYASGSSYTSEAGLFSVKNVVYDRNGNIESLKRYGKLNGSKELLDDLTLTYSGNKLVKVEDAGSEQGFNNGTTGIDDYGYDNAGNMKYDLNRSITNIQYNILNLPTSITHDNKRIDYIFDATGNKISTKYLNGGDLEKSIDQVGGIQYVDGKIVSIGTDYGTAIKIDDNFYYEYQLSDHLGNNRVSFGMLPETFVYQATMEDAYSSTEVSHFDNIVSTKSFVPDFNRTVPSKDVTNPSNVATLNGGNNAVGPAKVLEVNAGDKISMKVFASYINSTEGNTALISDLAGAVTSSMNMLADAELLGSISSLNSAIPGFSAGVDTHENVPKAYLNYIYLDENFANPQFGYHEVTDKAKNSFMELSIDIESPGKGFIFIYVANESTVPSADVYFDDLTIVHQSVNSAMQITHAADYYPFGMPSNLYKNQVLTDVMYLYQSKKLEEEINLYDFHARLYDPGTGRFLAVDPAGQFASPYNGMGNNPILGIDPDGRVWHIVIGAAVGGTINLLTNLDNIDSFGEGFAAFGVGAAVGGATAACGTCGGAVAIALGGGALIGATNNVIAQTGDGVGLDGVNWGDVGMSAAVGGISGVASYGAGTWASNNLASPLINSWNVQSPVFSAFINGTISGGVGGYAGGFTAGYALTGDLSAANKYGFSGLKTGASLGGGIASASAYYSATKQGISPWTGKAMPTKFQADNTNYLRKFASSKGWERGPNKNVETYGVYGEDGNFSWRIKIKQQGSFRVGLKSGSNVPRASVRLAEGLYFDPFINQTVPASQGNHIPLQQSYPKVQPAPVKINWWWR
ncbi:DUF6443 domain-containing protein [Fulvivirga lutea]|uniref:RHS repeat-associated core domain-containing protein n=1 Tax=Fulvivirga lutea TaxID=2810512 RepID=A0A975A282_9BACT|nr:DUF6443 domain-containing protein [Fulvivirga lutea]QSE99204.1 RHS repeat-associated core domain-containing protein [Fulvivirga lutea]